MTKAAMIVLCLCLTTGCAMWKASKVPATGSLQGSFGDPPKFYFAKMKATYFGGSGRLKGELGLIVAAPDKLLLEVRGPGGNPVSTFACDGKIVTLFELDGPRFYSGPANPLTMARLLPLPVEPHVAVSLLNGRLPMPVETTSYQTKAQARQLSGVHPLLGQVVVTRYSRTHWTWRLPDEELFITLKDPTKSGVFRDVLIKSKDTEVRLRLQDFDASGDPPDAEVFTLEPPPGVDTQPL